MKGGNVNNFIDHTTYEECAVIFKGVKYFFYGLIFDEEKKVYTYVIDSWDSSGNYIATVFNKTAPTKEKCIELAQSEPIFDGKTFWEAEADMEWVDW